jgi:hypothetical protein
MSFEIRLEFQKEPQQQNNNNNNHNNHHHNNNNNKLFQLIICYQFIVNLQ